MTIKNSRALNFTFPIFLALISVLLSAQTSFGQAPQTRLVPEDYPSPEAALAAANPGDIILLGGNTDWFTNLTIDKPVTIGGRGGSRLLSVRGDQPIIQVRSEDVVIQDLEFIFGVVGVEGLAEATRLRISNCTFEDLFGDAIRLTGCQEITIIDVVTANNDVLASSWIKWMAFCWSDPGQRATAGLALRLWPTMDW